MPGKTKTIGIRLTAELAKLLREEAAKHKLPPTTYAQKLVTDGLTRSASPVEEKLSELQAAIDRLERELPAKIRAAVGGSTRPGPDAAGVSSPLREWVNRPKAGG